MQVINYYADPTVLYEDRENGYLIKYPSFHNSNPFFDYPKTYSAINTPLREFAESIAAKYDDRAYLDYRITFDNRSGTRKIQIDFSGGGFPDGRNENSKKIEKQFIFDANNADEEHPPAMV